jgi:hypothetical protein
MGSSALTQNTIGIENTAVGFQALLSNIDGSDNTAVGDAALSANTSGTFNTAVGLSALASIGTGAFNTAVGGGAGSASTGSFNTYIGGFVVGVAGENNTIRIGDNLPQGGSTCFIGGIYSELVDPATAASVQMDATGKLGTQASSRRFKRDIKPMDKASEAILALKPVAFQYKSDAKSMPCYGLIAEDVAEVSPNLVVRDNKGELLNVRYDQVNAMLLNEFLKEHRKVQEQEATIARLQNRMDALIAHSEEQDSKIRRVTDQLEMSKTAPQVVTIK